MRTVRTDFVLRMANHDFAELFSIAAPSVVRYCAAPFACPLLKASAATALLLLAHSDSSVYED